MADITFAGATASYRQRPPAWSQSARLSLEVSANGDARLVYHAPGARLSPCAIMEGPASSVRGSHAPAGHARLDSLCEAIMGVWAMKALGCTVTRAHLEGAAAMVAGEVRGLVKDAPGWRMGRGVTLREIARMIEMKAITMGETER